MSNRIGGDRTKPETVVVNQVWCRSGRSGNHFVVTQIKGKLRSPSILTYTVETRRVHIVSLSTLLSPKNGYAVVEYLSICTHCKTSPKIRYGYKEDQPLYHVGCDCLEFDGQSPDLEVAIRSWKSNMKYLGIPVARLRPGSKGVVREAKARG